MRGEQPRRRGGRCVGPSDAGADARAGNTTLLAESARANDRRGLGCCGHRRRRGSGQVSDRRGAKANARRRSCGGGHRIARRVELLRHEGTGRPLIVGGCTSGALPCVCCARCTDARNLRVPRSPVGTGTERLRRFDVLASRSSSSWTTSQRGFPTAGRVPRLPQPRPSPRGPIHPTSSSCSTASTSGCANYRRRAQTE